MLFSTKSSLLFILLTLIFTTITHAAPVAASLQVERRGDPKPYEKELRENVDDITEMENKLKEENVEDRKAGERLGAYKDIFQRIRTTHDWLEKQEKESGDKDNSKEAKKVKKWYEWMVKEVKKIQEQIPKEGKEESRNLNDR